MQKAKTNKTQLPPYMPTPKQHFQGILFPSIVMPFLKNNQHSPLCYAKTSNGII
jgi:hypothetical protein